MNSLLLFKILRPAGGWLIALMLMTLVLPLSWDAPSAAEESTVQFELSAQDLDAELLDSPAEPNGNKQYSPQPAEAAKAVLDSAVANKRPSFGTGFLQVVNAAPRNVKLLPRFLPRPPPIS